MEQNNKILRVEESKFYFVIIAEKDGVEKYVSKSFPRVFQYTIKLSKAMRFYSEGQAIDFVDRFNVYGKYIIENAKVKKVTIQYRLEEKNNE